MSIGFGEHLNFMGDLKNPTITYGGCDTTEEFCSGGAEMELNSVIRIE